MNLGMADCGLNKNGIGKVAYDIYGQGGHSDPHSVTAHNVFYDSIGAEIIEIENESGKKIIFGEEQKIKIKRKDSLVGDEEQVILGKDFIITDEFIGYV